MDTLQTSGDNHTYTYWYMDPDGSGTSHSGATNDLHEMLTVGAGLPSTTLYTIRTGNGVIKEYGIQAFTSSAYAALGMTNPSPPAGAGTVAAVGGAGIAMAVGAFALVAYAISRATK